MFWRERRTKKNGTNGNSSVDAPITSHSHENLNSSEAALVQNYFNDFITAESRIKKSQILKAACEDKGITEVFKLSGDDIETRKKLLIIEFFSRFLKLKVEIKTQPLEYLNYFVNFFEFLNSDTEFKKLLANRHAIQIVLEILSLFPQKSLFPHIGKGPEYVEKLGVIQGLLKQNAI